MIPLKQTVAIHRGGTLDDWGVPSDGVSTTLSCRIDEKTQLVKDANGKEVVSSAVILLKGQVAVTFADRLEWTDETGNQYCRTPLAVAMIRDFGGKPIFTKVAV
ncbi:hypothetical protein [Heliophilum fasciatum]|uniref:Uncharacterized protein n=1 Tax=Heliophilum fasciatum TaxID=35700 RepID=A0A4R2RGP3_9FIRM|nr:hypothetical protein [Heliophilum fasciatum]MCW2279105.1 hypothetical protein [Heliophilum fasciatum]TCP61267.1 hypothetical protein EDD73_12920 [Heliophilum fasciatum]